MVVGQNPTFILHSEPLFLLMRPNNRTVKLVNFLQLEDSCGRLGPLLIYLPCEEPHNAQHERQSHAQHDAADGQLERALGVDRRFWSLWGRGSVLKQKGGFEVQKCSRAVFSDVDLTPPPSVIVLRLQLRDQSDVTACVFNQLVPA